MAYDMAQLTVAGITEGMSKKAKNAKGKGSTPATLQLENAGVAFTLHEYEHSNDHMDDGYGVEAATKLGYDQHQVYKTLLADTGDELVTAVVPVSGHLDMKALAAAVGAKKAQMADPKKAMRQTGYVVGGISPLGQKTHHRTVIDEGALAFDEMLVSGGKRGLSIGVAPKDLIAVLGAVTAPIATW
ncbi:aminoacyl-tRNA deacylase [Bifidobacterium vansinderenii]|uniref:Cys-tRNA(Pro)/Cys-tRNA(Cys) deacylase n=2 Tax=Bifidobacterium vansinderenii TaxID=1984871 RepID=A0A229VV10_9BIFI|nr:aminoacyl-tRNA deacylase [Bifidobacterium vansinderenii]